MSEVLEAYEEGLRGAVTRLHSARREVEGNMLQLSPESARRILVGFCDLLRHLPADERELFVKSIRIGVAGGECADGSALG